jgi:hypothetical protein
MLNSPARGLVLRRPVFTMSSSLSRNHAEKLSIALATMEKAFKAR